MGYGSSSVSNNVRVIPQQVQSTGAAQSTKAVGNAGTSSPLSSSAGKTDSVDLSFQMSGPAPAQGQKSDVGGLQAYIDAVDGNGNVNQGKIHAGGVSNETARTRVVEGYAGEFYSGTRVENAMQLNQNVGQVYRDLNSGDPNRENAATFALVASRYKNAGGNYDNGQLKNLLQQTGNSDLVTGGVGNKDVQTLGAVTAALRRGTLQISDIYGDTAKVNAVKDHGKYDKAIAAVTAGDLGSGINGAGNNAGNSGNAGNSTGGAGNAETGGAGNAQTGGAGTAQTGGAGTAETGGAGTAETGGAGTAQTGGAGTAETGGAGTSAMDAAASENESSEAIQTQIDSIDAQITSLEDANTELLDAITKNPALKTTNEAKIAKNNAKIAELNTQKDALVTKKEAAVARETEEAEAAQTEEAEAAEETEAAEQEEEAAQPAQVSSITPSMQAIAYSMRASA